MRTMAQIRDDVGLTYGALNRAAREIIPKAERRKMDVALQRQGVRFVERKRLIAAMGGLLLGVKTGIEEARAGK